MYNPDLLTLAVADQLRVSICNTVCKQESHVYHGDGGEGGDVLCFWDILLCNSDCSPYGESLYLKTSETRKMTTFTVCEAEMKSGDRNTPGKWDSKFPDFLKKRKKENKHKLNILFLLKMYILAFLVGSYPIYSKHFYF